MLNRFARTALALGLATTFAAAPALAAKGGRQFTSDAWFDVRVHATHTEAVVDDPATPEVEAATEIKFDGDGSANANGATLDLTLPKLENGSDSVVFTVNGPLVYGKKAKEYRGTASAELTVGGVMETCTMQVRVKIRKNSKGQFAVIKLQSKDDTALGFELHARARGAEGVEPVAPAPTPEE